MKLEPGPVLLPYKTWCFPMKEHYFFWSFAKYKSLTNRSTMKIVAFFGLLVLVASICDVSEALRCYKGVVAAYGVPLKAIDCDASVTYCARHSVVLQNFPPPNTISLYDCGIEAKMPRPSCPKKSYYFDGGYGRQQVCNTDLCNTKELCN